MGFLQNHLLQPPAWAMLHIQPQSSADSPSHAQRCYRSTVWSCCCPPCAAWAPAETHMEPLGPGVSPGGSGRRGAALPSSVTVLGTARALAVLGWSWGLREVVSWESHSLLPPLAASMGVWGHCHRHSPEAWSGDARGPVGLEAARAGVPRCSCPALP